MNTHIYPAVSAPPVARACPLCAHPNPLALKAWRNPDRGTCLHEEKGL